MSSPRRRSVRRSAIFSFRGKPAPSDSGSMQRVSSTRTSIYRQPASGDVKQQPSDGSGSAAPKPRPSLTRYPFNETPSQQSISASSNGSATNICRFKSRRNLFAPDTEKDDFHKACLKYTDIKELRQLFQASWSVDKSLCNTPESSTGRLPIHCIGLNQNLVLSPRHAPRVEQFILEELIPVYLDSIVTEDDNHYIPFTEVIVNWIRTRRALRSWETFNQKPKLKLRGIAKKILNKSRVAPRRLNDEDGGTDGEEAEDADGLGDMPNDKNDNQEEEDTSDLPPIVEWSLRILSAILDETLTMRRLGSGFNGGSGGHSNNLPENGQESSATMFGEDDGSDAASSTGHKSLQDHLAEITNNLVYEVATIPNFVQELLLIEDKDARSRVFELSIVHKVLFTPTSLGDGKWLISLLKDGIKNQSNKNASSSTSTKSLMIGSTVSMLQQQRGTFSSREVAPNNNKKDEAYNRAESAVFYLEAISTLDSQSDLNIDSRGHRRHDHIRSTYVKRQFKKHQDILFETVGALEGLVRHIAVLKDDLVTRAAVTPVIQQLLDRKIFCPFALTVAFFEGIQHILMIVCFRFGPSTGMFHLSPLDTGFPPQKYLVSNMVLASCVVFFILKETQRGIAKYTLSRRLFWHDLWSFWNLVDILPIFMVTFCLIAVDRTIRHRALVEHDPSEYGTIPFYLRVAISLTTPFLWLRVLSHIKMQNKQLATFILCTVEIMKDIKWFLLVLFIAMSGFAQMYVSLTGEPHTLQTSTQSTAFDGYLKAYTIMLGDLETSSLQMHPIITILFIFYTFGVTIVLLNILIAIVSDSYEKSMVSANSMLAKARLMFVARLLSVNFFHRLWRQGKTGNTRKKLNAAVFIFGALISKMVVGTVKAKLARLGQESLFIPAESSPNDDSLPSSNWGMSQLDIEATLLFILVSGVVFIMRFTLILIQNVADDQKGESDLVKLEPKKPSSFDYYIGELYEILSTRMDVLGEGTSGGDDDDPNANGAKQHHREILKIHRSVATSRNELKSELKNTTQQLRLAMDESEVRTTDDLAELSEDLTTELTAHKKEMVSLIKEAEDRIINAIAKKLDERAAF